MNNYSNIYRIIFVLLLGSSLNLFSQKHDMKDHPGIHGMVLLGDDTQYASHLPLFYSPHDYQVILKIKLDELSAVTYQKDKLAHPENKLYTIEPEKFVLPGIINDIKTFKTNIYRGHFERGGELIIKDAQVEITKVLYFHKLNKDKSEGNPCDYIVFGDQKEQFLAHQILNRPDFDELSKIDINNKKVALSLQNGEIVIVPGTTKKTGSLSEKCKGPEEYKKLNFNNPERIYLEFDDLK
ncbi:hypothetical protein CEY12_04330 [Chryseobacterium sp. T16E-39]|uniref:hypothetical protein n=1 Tax=Chryseobacterium sp. T16E-39 TaxID=2015076 RepID=UPI000B5B4418|nr:hypothetical protein [Chryseobacterium sp. T16E-39]ASK29372.1 hypothetical protein CEY12_04330 [Chryseobacterium sp. T16E-39]